MAYFSNGTEGMVFDHQCSICKYGQEPCPIAWVQHEYNYEQCDSPVAKKILSDLVQNNGTCLMWKQFKNDFRIDPEATEQSLFDEVFNKKPL